MLGTLVLTRLLCNRGVTKDKHVQLPLASDNHGNAFRTAQWLFQRMPTVAAHGACSSLYVLLCIPSHVKRELNPRADDLTHPIFSGFNPELRLEATPMLENLRIVPWRRGLWCSYHPVPSQADEDGMNPGLGPGRPTFPHFLRRVWWVCANSLTLLAGWAIAQIWRPSFESKRRYWFWVLLAFIP